MNNAHVGKKRSSFPRRRESITPTEQTSIDFTNPFDMIVLSHIFFIMLLLICPNLIAADLSETIIKIKPSIVGIGTFEKTRRPPNKLLATGFVIGKGNLIATNAHVIPESLNKNRKERLVVFIGTGKNPQYRSAEIVATDNFHDLAILQIQGTPLKPLQIELDKSKIKEGNAIAFTGFPIGAVLGLYPVTHRGIISAITPIAIPARHSSEISSRQIKYLKDPFKVYQLDATAYPGNSGSPVFSQKTGKVVGIINQVLVKGKKENVLKDPSAITYAIPVSFLNNLIKTTP